MQIDVQVALSGRTGRAMVYTIWQAGHLDQSYYFCSDVAFGGTNPPPGTPPAGTPPPGSPPVTRSPTASPSTSTPPAPGACSTA